MALHIRHLQYMLVLNWVQTLNWHDLCLHSILSQLRGKLGVNQVHQINIAWWFTLFDPILLLNLIPLVIISFLKLWLMLRLLFLFSGIFITILFNILLKVVFLQPRLQFDFVAFSISVFILTFLVAIRYMSDAERIFYLLLSFVLLVYSLSIKYFEVFLILGFFFFCHFIKFNFLFRCHYGPFFLSCLLDSFLGRCSNLPLQDITLISLLLFLYILFKIVTENGISSLRFLWRLQYLLCKNRYEISSCAWFDAWIFSIYDYVLSLTFIMKLLFFLQIYRFELS